MTNSLNLASVSVQTNFLFVANSYFNKLFLLLPFVSVPVSTFFSFVCFLLATVLVDMFLLLSVDPVSISTCTVFHSATIQTAE